MNWTEITVTVPLEKTEEASAIANMTVPYGIYIEDYSNLEQDVWEIAHVDLIDKDLSLKDRTHSIIHIYISECDNATEAIAFLKERFRAADINCEIKNVTVDDTQWNENWKKYFKAFEIGDRLAVCPSWETYDKSKTRTVISLDPAAAFGTGGHATTSLCLEILEKIVSSEKTLLDIGTGSGILSVASALLGIKNAVGVDIDAQSVKTAKENAKRNGVSEKTKFIVGDLAEKISDKYDIVCANIVADVIIRLFDNVSDYMKKDGLLIVSGIIDMRADDVEKSAVLHRFRIVETRIKEEWRAYILKKQSEEN